eukprot:gnl/MRDRNA2_/MRDRNA2_62695_c0_seq1.p1 gnl/MRDRNA2_/MRDRNA2_62695_c0~~gnl/MRDRNA2_/MRDRNA2_62695_c0_seq1.p1  ORF type:complete len:319 (+),score=41.01 gnl/MRDRNA2_/MRDRNA2_62695_c0_seq1:70-1026(+)
MSVDEKDEQKEAADALKWFKTAPMPYHILGRPYGHAYQFIKNDSGQPIRVWWQVTSEGFFKETREYGRCVLDVGEDTSVEFPARNPNWHEQMSVLSVCVESTPSESIAICEKKEVPEPGSWIRFNATDIMKAGVMLSTTATTTNQVNDIEDGNWHSELPWHTDGWLELHYDEYDAERIFGDAPWRRNVSADPYDENFDPVATKYFSKRMAHVFPEGEKLRLVNSPVIHRDVRTSIWNKTAQDNNEQASEKFLEGSPSEQGLSSADRSLYAKCGASALERHYNCLLVTAFFMFVLGGCSLKRVCSILKPVAVRQPLMDT